MIAFIPSNFYYYWLNFFSCFMSEKHDVTLTPFPVENLWPQCFHSVNLWKHICCGYERSSQRPWVYFYICEKSQYERPAGRPWSVVTFLRSLYLWNGMTNSRAVFFVRCHHSINFVFDRHRYPPVPATACGTRAEWEGIGDTIPLITPRATADPIEVLKHSRSCNAPDEINWPTPRSIEKVPI